MTGDYKVVKAKIVTTGRTIPEIREENKGQGMTYRDFENLKKAYDVFADAVAVFRLWEHEGFETAYLAGWDQAYDGQIMMAMYYAEQTNPFQDIYKRNFERFETDWKADTYDTSCAFALSQKDIEIIETLKEVGERNEAN
jgi:hypothetical protein